MSIQQMIAWKLTERTLLQFLPPPAAAARHRTMYIERTLLEEISRPRSDPAQTARFASLEADLAVFVHSPTIDPKYLHRLAPARDRVWEIRSVRDQPSIRVLGLFADKDVFIATNMATRSALGVFDSQQWRDAKRGANAIWLRLFQGVYQARPEIDVQKLVSGAVHGKYFTNRPAH